MKPDTQERPDFEKAADQHADRATSFVPRNDERWLSAWKSFMAGYGHSRKRIEELEAEVKTLQGKVKYWIDQDSGKIIKISELRQKLRQNGFLND